MRGEFRDSWAAIVKDARREVRQAFRRGAIIREPDWPLMIETFLACWRADHPGIRPATISHYREKLETHLLPYVRQRAIMTPLQFSKNHLRGYVNFLDEYVGTVTGRPLSPRSKQMAFDTARRFLRWVHEEFHTEADATAGIKSFRIDRTLEPRATSEDHFERLRRAFDRDTAEGVRDLAMLYVLGWCGLRVGELVGLDLGDLDAEEGTIRVRAETSKSRRPRNVPLPLRLRDGRAEPIPEVIEVLTEWVGIVTDSFPEAGNDQPLFCSLGFVLTKDRTGSVKPRGSRLSTSAVRAMLRRAARRAGIPATEVMPHRLRHHFGVQAHKEGVPLTALAKAMGHATIHMTQKYAQMNDAEVRAAFAKANPAKARLTRERQPKITSPRELRERLEREGTSVAEVARALFRKR